MDSTQLSWADAVLELVGSWLFLYVVMLAPLAYMMWNFIFGDCVVADALEARRLSASESNGTSVLSHGVGYGPPDTKPAALPPGIGLPPGVSTNSNKKPAVTYSDEERLNFRKKYLIGQRQGRLTVMLVYSFLAWQYHAYLFTYRSRFKAEHRAEMVRYNMVTPHQDSCSPLHFVWNMLGLVSNQLLYWTGGDALYSSAVVESEAPSTVGDVVLRLFECRYQESLYLFLFLSWLHLHLSLLLSTPRKLKRFEKQEKWKHESYCSKCGTVIPHMDHHCYFVHNCISRSNRSRFFFLLAVTVLFSFFLISEGTSYQWDVIMRYQLIHGTLTTESGEPGALSGVLHGVMGPKTVIYNIIWDKARPGEVERFSKYFRSLTIPEMIEMSSGTLFSSVCMVGGFCLLVFQLLLFYRDQTTISFFKVCAKLRQEEAQSKQTSNAAAQKNKGMFWGRFQKEAQFLRDVYHILIAGKAEMATIIICGMFIVCVLGYLFIF